MDSQEYEELLARLVRRLTNTQPALGAVINGGRSNRCAGTSGFRHQIDVSVHLQGRLVIIEAKHWTNKVGAEPVLTLQSRLLDIREQRPDETITGLLATTVGFTKGARLLAGHFGIAVDVVRSEADYVLKVWDRIDVVLADTVSVSDAVHVSVERSRRDDE